MIPLESWLYNYTGIFFPYVKQISYVSSHFVMWQMISTRDIKIEQNK